MTEEQLNFLRNNTSVPEEDYQYCVFNNDGVFTPRYDKDGVRIATGEDSYNEYLNPPRQEPTSEDKITLLEEQVKQQEQAIGLIATQVAKNTLLNGGN